MAGRVEQRGYVVRPLSLSGPFSETSFLLINSYLSRSSETHSESLVALRGDTATGRPLPPPPSRTLRFGASSKFI